MRRKLYIGAFLAAAVGIVAGGSLLNRSDAQDPSKNADEKKASDLFELLKKDLDSKKDVVPPPLVIPPPKEVSEKEKTPILTPPAGGQAPGALQLPPLGKEDGPKKADPMPGPLVIPPPVIVNQPAQLDPKPAATGEPKKADPLPLPITPKAEPKESSIFPPLQPDPGAKPSIQFPKPEKDDSVNPNVKPTFPSDKPSTLPPLANPKQKEDPLTFPALPPQTKPDKADPTKPVVDTQRPVSDSAIQFGSKPTQPIVDEIAKIKNCPWSLQVDVVDGQTIVIATVNKKHEFKIVCQSLDLQTGKGTLKAVGKVQITGDMITGSCEQLAIPLMEDRLMLEGNAVVSIQKTSANVSDTKPAAFELKGTSLDLRISDLPGARILQTSMQKAVDLNVRQTASSTADAKKWTGLGKLVRNHAKVGPEWRLEKSTGDVIAYITTNQGKSLEGFVGRTISVFGATEEMVGTTPVLRVTHIALP